MKKYLLIAIYILGLLTTTEGASRRFTTLSVNKGLSQLNVTCLFQDQQGYLWIGTRIGLNKYNGNSFEVYHHHVLDTTSISNDYINAIAEDRDENLWIGTNSGLNRLDRQRHRFEHFFPFKEKISTGNKIFSLCTDEHGQLWVGTQRGVFIYDEEKNRLVAVPIPDVDDRAITRIWAHDGMLYIATNAVGFAIYDIQKKQMRKTYRHQAGLPSIADDNIRDFCLDSQGNIWIGTFQKGISIIPADGSSIRQLNTDNGLSNDEIRCIRQSPKGDIWIGTFFGLDVYDPKTQQITVYNNGAMGNLSHYSIYDILFDHTQTVWVGTYAGGLNYMNPYSHLFDFYNLSQQLNAHTGIFGPAIEKDGILYICSEGGGLIAYNLSTGKAQAFIPKQGGTSTNKQKDNIKTVYLDNDRLLCGTGEGAIYAFSLKTHDFTLLYKINNMRPIYHISRNLSGNYVIGCISSDQGFQIISPDWKSNITTGFDIQGKGKFHFRDVITICEIERDVYLIGTKNYGLYYYNHRTHQLTNYGSEDNCGFSINTIHKDRSGRIWIGSFDGGLSELNLSTGTFTHYGEKNGMPSNQVCKIVEDASGAIWFSTLNGISRLDPSTGKITNYGWESGLQVQEFTQCSGSLLPDGRLYFGGNNGFELFTPANMVANKHIPPVTIDKLFLNNRQVYPGDGTDILKEDVSFQKKIVLRHNQTNISIEYCALNYIFSSKNEYMYKLEGFDKEWNRVGNRRSAFYTNIPPGRYTFMVKGSNNDGVWNDKPATLEIVVLSPPWKSWWAWLIYLLIAGGIITLIVRHYAERRKLQNDIRMREMEAEVHERYYQERNSLFTVFSHELRTPLTLIKAPLEDIAKRSDLDSDTRGKTNMMLRNTRRMMNLVNDLMDLQKNESGSLKPHVYEYDLLRLSRESVASFQDMAMYRNILLSHAPAEGTLKLWFDWNLMEKVFFNLLSNAFKNVPDDGAVSVVVTNNERQATITIHNTGSHIAPNELEKIFQPFYQGVQNNNTKPGSGIGLSLSKSIMTLHHGSMRAENTADGVSFIFTLPVDKEVFSHDDILEKPVEQAVSFEVAKPEELTTSRSAHTHTVLVVEDNADLNQYICSCLSEKYNVLSADNGETGLKKAMDSLPDLVITDIMMPKMDGIEMSRQLKSNVNTSHIPIIMLTAKTTTDDIREGLQMGVDDYVTKPFESSILKVRVDNLIALREQLKERYSKEFSLHSLDIDMTSVDEQFMQKLYTTMKENLNNGDMNLDAFCSELAMSKSNCYRKIKTLTGMSPNEFIRKFRLDTAARMLRETDKSITDIYIAVGFNSPAYFSNCFRAQFGMSPTEYKNQA